MECHASCRLFPIKRSNPCRSRRAHQVAKSLREQLHLCQELAWELNAEVHAELASTRGKKRGLVADSATASSPVVALPVRIIVMHVHL